MTRDGAEKSGAEGKKREKEKEQREKRANYKPPGKKRRECVRESLNTFGARASARAASVGWAARAR